MSELRSSAIGAQIGVAAALCAWLGLWAAAGVSSAAASCGSRPGTPRDVKAFAESATAMRVEWTNTTGKYAAKLGLPVSTESKLFKETGIPLADASNYFDMYFRDAETKPIGRDLTGVRIGHSGESGEVINYVFGNLSPNTRYCFALRARTEAGTQGCVSAQTSNWACATTKAR